MPRFTGNKSTDESIQENIEQNLYRIDLTTQAMGFGPLSPQELNSIYQFAVSQVQEALRTKGRYPREPISSPMAQSKLPLLFGRQPNL